MATGTDKELYAAIHRLKATSEFQVFVDRLSTELVQTDKTGRRLEGIDLHRNQGKALYIETLLEMVDRSGEILTKLNAQTP